jgi:aldehyde:ferredoxin oxidoreductase
MNGYAGWILRINLSEQRIIKEELDLEVARQYIGGNALGIRMFYDEVTPDTSSLSAKNKLFLLTGPVTGTSFPSAGRVQAIFKSPLTGLLTDSSVGGFWGAELKRAGFDGVILEGKSDHPVYIWISDGEAAIRDALDLWGLDALDVQGTIRNKLGDKRIRTLAIGPSGERALPMASIVTDDARVHGRGGGGAVMGSKYVKAIAVRGNGRVTVANADEFSRLSKKISEGTYAESWEKYGTASSLDGWWDKGDVPVKNFKIGRWDPALKVGGKAMADTILVKGKGCWACKNNCGREVAFENDNYKYHGAGPEYETIGLLGTNLMIDDLEVITIANDICNRSGIDTISVGGSIAFAIEAFEKGLLTANDTGGIQLKWGDPETFLKVLKMTVVGEGFGAFVAKGTKMMSQKLGEKSKPFALEVKGMEVPAHDPRALFAMGVAYATSPRGACHMHAPTMVFEHGGPAPEPEWGLTGAYPAQSSEHKGLLAKVIQDKGHIISSMAACYFIGLFCQPSELALALELATGNSYTSDSLHRIAERAYAIQRVYNILAAGITAADDRLPERLLEPFAEGEAKGIVPDIQTMLRDYYDARGWEPDGKPSREILEELGLVEIIKDLYATESL